MSKAEPLVVNGWNILVHPLFEFQLKELIKEVKSLRDKNSISYKTKNPYKRLQAIYKLAFEIIPQDPSSSAYRQGKTLGDDYKHWFRAKFFQQYRLFFRYDSKSKIIIYTWVNDESTKRAYGSSSDAYLTFEKRLNNGHPPNDWTELLNESLADIEPIEK